MTAPEGHALEPRPALHPPIAVSACGGGSVDLRADPWDGTGQPFFLHCSRRQWDELRARVKSGALDAVLYLTGVNLDASLGP